MVAGSKKAYGIGAVVLAVAVVGIIGWRAIVPSTEPEPQLQTLCGYMRTAAGATCTVAVAPDAFPVGNVVVLPDPPDLNSPLPPTHRDFASVCWMELKDQAEINKLLARPAVDMSLPGFSADVSRKLKAGATISLAEADNLKIVAGSNSNLVKTISVAPRDAHVLQLDQGQIENLLHRPEVREDCFSRLLGPRTRLVVSLIYANGVDYSVTSTDDHHLDLDAAIKTGYINVDAGPQATTGGKFTTNLSVEAPRVLGAVFADDLMIEDLKKMIVKGNSITASSSNRVSVVTGGANNIAGAKQQVSRQNPDGSLTTDAELFRNIWQSEARRVVPQNGNSSVEVRSPVVNGSATASQTSSTASSANPSASIALNTNINIAPGNFTVSVTIPSPFPFPLGGGTRTQVFSGPAPVAMTQRAAGEFEVFKRLDGAETLSIRLTRNAGDPQSIRNNEPIIVRVVDANNRQIGPSSNIDIQQIGPDGAVVKAILGNAGIYHVYASQEALIPAEAGIAVRSNINITASLGQDAPEPVRHGSLEPHNQTPDRTAPSSDPG